MVIPTPGPLYTRYTDQYRRMLRWYSRFERIHSGEDLGDCERLKDDILAFFINCFHLKDWVKWDSGIKPETIEGFINENACLQFCADIANGAKHLALDHGRICTDSGCLRHAILVDKQSSVGKFTLILQESNEEIIDSFEIATTCIQKWREFFFQNNLNV